MGKEAEEGHREVSEEQREGWTEEEEGQRENGERKTGRETMTDK